MPILRSAAVRHLGAASLVAAVLLAGCASEAEPVPVPPVDAEPAEVVEALIAAIGARDAEAVATLTDAEFASMLEDTWFGVRFVEAELGAPVGGDACAYTAHAETECVRVPAQLVLENTDSSMPSGEPVGWGYLVVREGPGERWLVVDQGVA